MTVTTNLVEQLEHGSLHFGVSTRFAVLSLTTDGVDLVHENYGGSMLSSHHEQFSHLHKKGYALPTRRKSALALSEEGTTSLCANVPKTIRSSYTQSKLRSTDNK